MNGIGDYVTSIKEVQRLAAQVAIELKGDAPGHPFRGNQWDGGSGGSGDSNDRINSVVDSSGFDRNRIVIEDGKSGVLGEYKPDDGKVHLYSNNILSENEQSIKGLLAHEFAHLESADIFMKYFNQRQNPNGDQSVFNALSNHVSDCLSEGDFTSYVSYFSKRFDQSATLNNRFLLLSEGYAESRRMEHEGKEYPQSWKKLHSVIEKLK